MPCSADLKSEVREGSPQEREAYACYECHVCMEKRWGGMDGGGKACLQALPSCCKVKSQTAAGGGGIFPSFLEGH